MDDGLDAVAEGQLHQHAGDVGLDRGLADGEGGRDLAVRQPAGQEAQDVRLAVPLGAAADGLVRWWVPVLTGLGVVAFLAVGAGPLPVFSPVLLLAGYGLLARALPPRPLDRVPSPAPEPVSA